MKKTIITIALLAICGLMNAQTTMKVKTIQEKTVLSQAYIECSIKVDFPVSASGTLNNRIMKFLLDVMRVDVDNCLGWAAGATRPQTRVYGMTSFRNYMKAYTKNIVNYGKKEEGDNCSCDIHIKFLGQGPKFVCYELESSQVVMSASRNFYTMNYYIVNKATGKPVKNMFKDNTEDKLYALAKKHLKNDEERKSLDEENSRSVPYYWMEDTKYVHFVYGATTYTVTTGKIPVNEAKPYMTSEMKALL